MSGEFVAAMEDVLVLYEMPYDERYPTVCLDEKPVVLHAEVRAVLPLVPGRVERRDYEYERHGTANLFVMVEPLAGWRHVAVTARRTKQDYAECLRYLVEERHPEAERIYLVQDNLNTHTAGALYETFPPAQARAILDRLEFHPTPKHGSWLNQAEIDTRCMALSSLAGWMGYAGHSERLPRSRSPGSQAADPFRNRGIRSL
jgi:hypothetical protein